MTRNIFEESVNRIIGMNMSIAMNDYESDRYSDMRVVSLVVARNNLIQSEDILPQCNQIKIVGNIKQSWLKTFVLKLTTDKFICSED